MSIINILNGILNISTESASILHVLGGFTSVFYESLNEGLTLLPQIDYWSFQLASPKYRKLLSFVTGWTWLIGNWTITLSVNFGFASLIAASVALYHPEFGTEVQSWQLLLIFYAICLMTFVIVAFGNKLLPMVDTICAAFTAIAIFITLVCLSAKADVGRNSPSFTLVCVAVTKYLLGMIMALT